VQSATHFEMANYVLGLKSSAQCMSLVERPTKVYLASRMGLGCQVPFSLSTCVGNQSLLLLGPDVFQVCK